MHVVIGKGPIGKATARLLASQDTPVTLISRTPAAAEPGITPIALDATNSPVLSEASSGAEVIYNCASPAYHRWAKDWPPLARAVLETAKATGAVLVTMSNLYGYGPANKPYTEDTPSGATGPKGRTRAQLWEQALAEHQAGRVRVAEARASDYFGPGVTLGYLADRMLPRLLKGKRVSVIGDPDAPHSWTYLPDIAQALVRIGECEKAWGHAWHVPTAPAFSFRQAVEGLRTALDRPPVPVTSIPWPVLATLGLVVPPLRGLSEVRYQFDHPFVVDSTRFTETFHQRAMASDEALAATARWWQNR